MKYIIKFCMEYGIKIVFIIFIFIIIETGSVLGEEKPPPPDCTGIKNNEERLNCFDKLSASNKNKEDQNKKKDKNKSEDDSKKNSILTKLWELDDYDSDKTILQYKSCYVLPYTYNDKPNNDPVQEVDPDKEVLESEAKFQLSIKSKLKNNLFIDGLDLWFTYTQLSLWQVYNFDDSCPFRDTNYEPEILLNYHMNTNLGLKLRYINIGFNHQSNGRSEPRSRSWNRIVSNLGFERGDFVLLLELWYRIPEETEDDDNSDINEYMGNGEIQCYYFIGKHRIGMMLRNNLDVDENRGAIELDLSISLPIFDNVDLYFQYFSGYGECLLDYDHYINRIGLGVIITDW